MYHLQISTLAECTYGRQELTVRVRNSSERSEEIKQRRKNHGKTMQVEDEALSPQEESAKAAILAECDKLAQAGVTFVAVHFDGYGDDGSTRK